MLNFSASSFDPKTVQPLLNANSATDITTSFDRFCSNSPLQALDQELDQLSVAFCESLSELAVALEPAATLQDRLAHIAGAFEPAKTLRQEFSALAAEFRPQPTGSAAVSLQVSRKLCGGRIEAHGHQRGELAKSARRRGTLVREVLDAFNSLKTATPPPTCSPLSGREQQRSPLSPEDSCMAFKLGGGTEADLPGFDPAFRYRTRGTRTDSSFTRTIIRDTRPPKKRVEPPALITPPFEVGKSNFFVSLQPNSLARECWLVFMPLANSASGRCGRTLSH